MTTINFFKSGDVFYGFEEHGHTGYADEGEDILCSALSSMSMLIINAIQEAYHGTVNLHIDEDTADLHIIAPDALNFQDSLKQFAISGLIYAYYCQLNDLTFEYGDFLQIHIIEREQGTQQK